MTWSDRCRLALPVLLIAALTLVYLNHFDNAFHFDDNHTIVDNQYIRDIRNVPRFFINPETESSLPENRTYRPVITTLNAFDYWLAGRLDSRVFHAHIFIEFLLLLTLIYFFFRKVFYAASGQTHHYVALAGTALFAFHTATAETINYIIARSDGFSTLMVLTSLLIYVSTNGWKRQLGLLPFVLGCLAKPTTLMLAPLAALYSLLLERPGLLVRDESCSVALALQRTVRHSWSYFFVGALMYAFTRSMYPDTWIPGGPPVVEYLNTQAFVILVYLKTFLLPTGLSADSDLGVIKELLAPRVLLGLAVILLLVIAAWVAATYRRGLPISYGILWFLVCLVPTSSIVPLAEVMNHHRTFFPYIGLVLATSWGVFLGIDHLSERHSQRWKPIAVFLVAIVLVLHAAGTYSRNQVWDSDLTLWRNVTEKSPQNGRGLMNYGLALMARGDFEQAIHYYELAFSTDYRNHPYLYVNLAIASDALGRQRGDNQLITQAETYFRVAVERGRRYPQTHYRYAEWLNRHGRSSEAIDYLKTALELSPGLKPARDLLRQVAATTEEELVFARENAVKLGTPEAFLDLSLQYYNAGRFEDCIDAASDALQLRADYAAAHNNICAALNQLGRFEQAINACEDALAIEPGHELAQGNLAWARQNAQSVSK